VNQDTNALGRAGEDARILPQSSFWFFPITPSLDDGVYVKTMKCREVGKQRFMMNAVLEVNPYVNDGPSRGWKIHGIPKRAHRRNKHRIRWVRRTLSTSFDPSQLSRTRFK